MDNILLHVAGIALLEIIFYFTYIGPMESKIFKDTFGSSIQHTLVTQDTNSPFHPSNNISTFIINYEQQKGNEFGEQLKEESDESQEDRDNYNNKLFIQMLEYLGLGFIFIIIIFVIRKYYFTTADANEPPEGFSRELSIHDIEENSTEDNSGLISKRNRKEAPYKKYLTNFLYYFTLAGMILLFEYIFFQYIVLKYHIITNKEIEYIVYQKLFESFDTEAKYLL